MKKLSIETIEVVESGKYYLSIGFNSPWDNYIQFRIPKIIAVLINKKNSINK